MHYWTDLRGRRDSISRVLGVTDMNAFFGAVVPLWDADGRYSYTLSCNTVNIFSIDDSP